MEEKEKEKEGGGFSEIFFTFPLPFFHSWGAGQEEEEGGSSFGRNEVFVPLFPIPLLPKSGRGDSAHPVTISQWREDCKTLFDHHGCEGETETGSFLHTPTKKPRSTFLNRSERSAFFPSLFFEQRTHSGLI